jgi:hypothetical protein
MLHMEIDAWTIFINSIHRGGGGGGGRRRQLMVSDLHWFISITKRDYVLLQPHGPQLMLIADGIYLRLYW